MPLIASTPTARALLSAGLVALAVAGTAALFALTGKSAAAVGFGMLVAPMLVCAAPFAVACTTRLSAILGAAGIAAIGATVWRLRPRNDGDYMLPAVVIVVAAVQVGLLAARVRSRSATVGAAIAAAVLACPAWIGVFAVLPRIRPIGPPFSDLPMEGEWGVLLAAYALVLVELAAVASGVAAVRLPLLDADARERSVER